MASGVAPLALIVGAGIGGLTAALALHRVGLRVSLVDAEREAREVGGGVILHPPAVAALSQLGLAPALASVAVELRRRVRVSREGRELGAEPLGRAAGARDPLLGVQRGELERLLLAALDVRLGAGTLRRERKLLGFRSRPDGGVAVEVGERAGGAWSIDADLLVGADGLRSLVRRQLHPAEPEPRWTGATVWRGVTLAKPPHGGAWVSIEGGDRAFSCWPVGRPSPGAERAPLAWTATVAGGSAARRREELWDRPGRREDVIPAFAGWSAGGLDVAAIVGAAETVLEMRAVEHDPVARWTFGRTTLLGDAAHPPSPGGVDAASDAVLDATALAEALGPAVADLAARESRTIHADFYDTPDSVSGALGAYERARMR